MNFYETKKKSQLTTVWDNFYQVFGFGHIPRIQKENHIPKRGDFFHKEQKHNGQHKFKKSLKSWVYAI